MTTGALKGAEVGFSHPEVPTQRLGWCRYDSERKGVGRIQKHLLALVITPLSDEGR